MLYQPPHAEIHQVLTPSPASTAQVLPACIIGPNYSLNRYEVADEKASIGVGAYNPGSETTYTYPNKAVGGKVDQESVTVHLDNVRAEYYNSGTNSSLATGALNTVSSETLVWKTGDGYDRSPIFNGRDVQVGDEVYLSGGGTSLTTKVNGFATVGDDSSSIGAITANAANSSLTQGYNVPAAAATQPAYSGDTPAAALQVTLTSSTYAGYFDSEQYTDTYLVTVESGSTVNDASFTVSTQSGVVAPRSGLRLLPVDGAPGSFTLVLDNNRGNNLVATFVVTGAGSFLFNDGDQWTFTAQAEVAVATVANNTAGSYTGPENLTYTVTVIRGGPYYDGTNASYCGRVLVTSTDLDSSGPFNVQDGVSFPVGSYGATASISGYIGGLIPGDRWTIAATSGKSGAYGTLILADALPTGLQDLTTGVTMSLRLSRANILVPEVRNANLGIDNYVPTADGVTINGRITITDRNFPGQQLPVTSAQVYIAHRDLLANYGNGWGSLNNTADIARVLGTIDPHNPLAYGVYMAALNSANSVVYFISVDSDDLAGYTKALGILAKTNTVYNLVPLSTDKAVMDAVVGHVNAMSTPLAAKWRSTFLSPSVTTNALLYDLNQGGPWQASVVGNLVTTIGGHFVSDGVRPGDEFLTNFYIDELGNTVYSTYAIDHVVTENTLVLVSSVPVDITIPSKFQIRRNYSTQEQINNYIAVATSYNNRRVKAVFPDTVVNGGVELAGYYVAAACAGLKAGVAPQQGLTNSSLLGFDRVPKSVVTYTDGQLNELAAAGVWIITQDGLGGTPYVRHQLTTDTSGVNFQEDSITANVDSVSYGLQVVLNPFIGHYNNNAEARSLLFKAIQSKINFYASTATYVQGAGNQLGPESYIVSLAANPTFKDRVDISIALDVPAPINYIVVTLTV